MTMYIYLKILDLANGELAQTGSCMAEIAEDLGSNPTGGKILLVDHFLTSL